MAVERLTGGNTPKDLADPRTFPTIWDETMDVLETKGWISTEVIDATGTWNQLAGAKTIEVWCFGGGGGPGSGRKGAEGSARAGGMAGQNGAVSHAIFNAADVPASLTVTIGAAGTPGAAQATNSTNGNFGTAGGQTSFGTLLVAEGGLRGEGGTNAAVAHSNLQRRGTFPMSRVGDTSITAQPTGVGPGQAGSGGAGGGRTTGNSGQFGGLGGATPGAAGGTGLGGAGAAGVGTLGGSGGGGGMGYDAFGTGTANMPGGPGGHPGGAGGGGGAGVDGVANSGVGGTPAAGRCIVIQRG